MPGALFNPNVKFIFPSLSRSNSCSLSTCNRPIIVNMARHEGYWASIEDEIKTHLKKAIPNRPPVSVFEPMHYLAFAAPRTSAPSLCIAACELVGGVRDQAMAAASAIHLMHVAAYNHQHISLTKRHNSTVQHAFGPNIELLTGDGMIPLGIELLEKSMDQAQNNSGKILRVIIEITRAIGPQGMVDGQFSLLKSDELNDIELIEYVAKKKEGGLHACGAVCGAILGGGSEEEIEKLRKYGLYSGIIQGMLYGVGRNKKGTEERVETLRVLAIKELENFKSRKVETLKSLVEPNLLSV